MSNDRYPSSLKRFLRYFVGNSVVERILISVAALVTAVLVSSVIVLIAGYLSGEGFNPIEIFSVLVNGAFGSPFDLNSSQLFNPDWSPVNFLMAVTLKETTLLIFAGLGVALAFRGDLFNIGVQGQLVLGALAAALALVWVGPYVPTGLVGTVVLTLFGLLVGAIAGGLFGALPGALKAYADANEVITTIMLNFVATGVAFYSVSTYFNDPTLQSVKTRPIPDHGRIQGFIYPEGGQFSIVSLLLALVAAAGIYYLLRYTSFGYDLRVSGKQAPAALYGGANAEQMIVSTMTLSGALSGVAGAMWSMMVIGAWRTGVPGLGFDGIAVSVLAGNNPIGVIPASLLFGVLKGGGNAINLQLGVPPELVAVLRGLIILFVAMPEFFRMIGNRVGIESNAAAAAGGDVDE
ncbi:MAG: ABC transporter permease [Halapricum sp.]